MDIFLIRHQRCSLHLQYGAGILAQYSLPALPHVGIFTSHSQASQALASFASPIRPPEPTAYLMRNLAMLPLPTAHCSHLQPLPLLLLNLLSQLHKQFLIIMLRYKSPASALVFMTRCK